MGNGAVTLAWEGLPPAGSIDLAQVEAALGGVRRITYAPPHVYPMSAPHFAPQPEAARRIPPGRLGLYVHVPYCHYACTFCFYAKQIGADAAERERMTAALLRELEAVAPGTPLQQLYVGGGTPTALPAEQLDRLLEAIRARTRDDGGSVHTVEASPESLADAHLRVLRRRGIGRASLGVQSFDDRVLAAVRRGHGGGQARQACERLAGSGLIVNVDLIYGLPGQTPADFAADVATLAGLAVDSMTLYNLRVNERTPVARILREEERFDLQRLVAWRAFVKRTAAAHGYRQTRWHTFVRADWDARKPVFADDTSRGNQFGIGPSARSRLAGTVYRNAARLDEYVARIAAGRSPVEETMQLDDEGRRARFVALTLGEGAPLDREEYAATFATAFDEDYGASAQQLRAAGLIDDDGRRIALTEAGGLVWDLVSLALYPAGVRAWLDARQPVATTPDRLTR